jgi:hypothetical protein
MIFIYFNWVSTRCQWSVDLYENKKRDSTKGETIREQRIHKINKKLKIILKNISRVIRK